MEGGGGPVDREYPIYIYQKESIEDGYNNARITMYVAGREKTEVLR